VKHIAVSPEDEKDDYDKEIFYTLLESPMTKISIFKN
jgi:hypothetical protein